MRLGQIALRLRARNLTDFGQRVYGAAEFALAQESTLKEECAFIIPLLETDQGDNKYDNSVNQMINERFGIVVALKNDMSVTEKLGITAFDRLYTIRQRLFCTFLGWRPTETEMPVYYKGGRLLDLNRAWLWWQFEFQQETHITDSADGVFSTACITDTYDDFMSIYTQWLTSSENQAVLPISGTAPLLPETMTAPDFNTIIGFDYGFGQGFSQGFRTLEAAAAE